MILAVMIAIFTIDVILLLIFKFASHRTIACIVSTANKPLVGTLITIGDVTRNTAIHTIHMQISGQVFRG